MMLIYISNFPLIESQQSVSTVPILWPVKRGRNWISCPPLQKALYLYKVFRSVGWLKCLANCQTDDAEWGYIGGMDDQWNVELNNGSDNYNLVQRGLGLLEIAEVTEADNGTEYRCTVVSKDRESVHIVLLVQPDEGKFKKKN